MIIYIENSINSIEEIEPEILTSNEVYFVFRDEEIFHSNDELLNWINTSPLKSKFHTFLQYK